MISYSDTGPCRQAAQPAAKLDPCAALDADSYRSHPAGAPIMSAFRRAVVGIGKALRDTGQSIERMGCRAQDNWIFQEKFCRHRAVMNLFDQKPKMAPNVFVAPNASVIGNVEIKPNSSIWCVPHPACVCGVCVHRAIASC